MPPNGLLHYYSICIFLKYVNKKTAHKVEQFLIIIKVYSSHSLSENISSHMLKKALATGVKVRFELTIRYRFLFKCKSLILLTLILLRSM